MADNKIIIDGVDVSECCWCDSEPNTEPYCRINDGEDLNCEENPNCYFKQLKRKEQECEEYANKVEYIHAFLKDPHNYGSFKPMWGSFLLHWLFNENLGDFFPQEAYEMTDTITEKEKQIIKYKQALDEIEHAISNFPSEGVQEMSQTQIECSQYFLSVSETKLQKILDIINKAKVGG